MKRMKIIVVLIVFYSGCVLLRQDLIDMVTRQQLR